MSAGGRRDLAAERRQRERNLAARQREMQKQVAERKAGWAENQLTDNIARTVEPEVDEQIWAGRRWWVERWWLRPLLLAAILISVAGIVVSVISGSIFGAVVSIPALHFSFSTWLHVRNHGG